MVVDVVTEPTFSVGAPAVLFGDVAGLGIRPYDVTADGELFIVMQAAGDVRMNVVVGWFRELEQLVPAS